MAADCSGARRWRLDLRGSRRVAPPRDTSRPYVGVTNPTSCRIVPVTGDPLRSLGLVGDVENYLLDG